jgi:hypothetical protein
VNKKEAKKTLFTPWGTGGATHARRGVKVFWFFFSKKNILLSLHPYPPGGREPFDRILAGASHGPRYR